MRPYNPELLRLQSDIRAFVQKLREDGIDELSARRLEQISSDIQNDASYWVHNNIYDAFNATALIDHARATYQRRAGWVTLLEVLRNVLILMPILLTWFALSQAAQAYLEALRRAPELIEKPFLLLWEEGFAGRLSDFLGQPLTFSRVAAIDSALIGIMLLLTLVVMIRGSYQAENALRRAVELSAELDDLLWRASRLMDDARWKKLATSEERSLALLESLQRFTENFETRRAELDRVIELENQRMGAMGEVRQKSVDELAEVTGDLRTAAHEMAAAAGQVAQAMQSAQALRDETARLNEAHARLEGLLQNLTPAFGAFEEAARRLGEVEERTTTELAKSLEQDHARAAELAESVRSLNRGVRELVSEQMDLKNLLSDEVAGRGRWMKALEQTTARLEAAARAPEMPD